MGINTHLEGLHHQIFGHIPAPSAFPSAVGTRILANFADEDRRNLDFYPANLRKNCRKIKNSRIDRLKRDDTKLQFCQIPSARRTNESDLT